VTQIRFDLRASSRITTFIGSPFRSRSRGPRRVRVAEELPPSAVPVPGPAESHSCDSINARAFVIDRRGCVTQCLIEIFRFEERVIRYQCGSVWVRCQKFQDAADGNSHAPNARFSAAFPRFHRYPIKLANCRHVFSLYHAAQRTARATRTCRRPTPPTGRPAARRTSRRRSASWMPAPPVRPLTRRSSRGRPDAASRPTKNHQKSTPPKCQSPHSEIYFQLSPALFYSLLPKHLLTSHASPQARFYSVPLDLSATLKSRRGLALLTAPVVWEPFCFLPPFGGADAIMRRQFALTSLFSTFVASTATHHASPPNGDPMHRSIPPSFCAPTRRRPQTRAATWDRLTPIPGHRAFPTM